MFTPASGPKHNWSRRVTLASPTPAPVCCVLETFEHVPGPESSTVIVKLHRQNAQSALNHPSSNCVANAVPDGVLHERLDRQNRNQRLLGLFVHLDHGCKPWSQPETLNFEVSPYDLQLLRQWYQYLVGLKEISEDFRKVEHRTAARRQLRAE